MKRTIIELQIKDYNDARAKISSILSNENYYPRIEDGEHIWKNGTGFLTAIKYIKYKFTNNNSVIVSGWIRPPVGNEQDLSGIIGCIPKNKVKSTIKRIQTSLLQ